MLTVPLILGTEREGRQSEHVARFVHARMRSRQDVEAPWIDPRDWPFGNLQARAIDVRDVPEAVAKGEGAGTAPAQVERSLEEFVQGMHGADGFVIVTPEYNFGYPGALKNLLDVTLKPWQRKPFGLVACGGASGGLRAIDNLRQVVAGLGGVAVPAHVQVPHVGKAFGPEGPLEDAEAWTRRVDHFLDEVLWYARALRDARRA